MLYVYYTCMGKSELNEKVFGNTVSLIIDLAGENGIASVRLNKCLIIVDALHQALHRESLTGATYIKHKYGPVLGKEAYDLLQKMIDSEEIMVFEEMISPNVCEINHYLGPGVKASKDSFDEDQIKIISWAVSTVMNMTANQLTDTTHDRSYQKTPMFHEIKLDDVYSWKIEDAPLPLTEEEFNNIDEIIKENLDELNSFVSAEQAAPY